MKNLLTSIKVKFALTMLFVLLCASVFAQADSTATATNPIIDLIPKTWVAALAVILGLYELAIRLYPTVKDYSIVGKIFAALKYASDELNNKKESK